MYASAMLEITDFDLCDLSPVDGIDALALLRCLPLTVSERDGKLVVSGLSALNAEDRTSATRWAKEWRDEILHWLAWEELSPAQRNAAEREALRSFWPLCRRYTSWQQVKSVLRAHQIRVVRNGEDFDLPDAAAFPFEQLPGLVAFLHYNTKIILQNLDDLGENNDR